MGRRGQEEMPDFVSDDASQDQAEALVGPQGSRVLAGPRGYGRRLVQGDERRGTGTSAMHQLAEQRGII
jgi:hypothetical protein